MVHPVNQLGFSPNGNVYRKSDSNEKRGLALFGGLSAIKVGKDIYDSTNELKFAKNLENAIKDKKNLSKDAKKAIKEIFNNKMPTEDLMKGIVNDKKVALAYSIVLGGLTIGVNLLLGKLIGKTIDSVVNDRRMIDSDGAETFILKQQMQNAPVEENMEETENLDENLGEIQKPENQAADEEFVGEDEPIETRFVDEGESIESSESEEEISDIVPEETTDDEIAEDKFDEVSHEAAEEEFDDIEEDEE